MRTCLGIVGALLGLLIIAVLSTSWIVVYVHQRDEGLRVIVPAPVFLADIALRIAGVQAQHIEMPPEARDFLPMIRPIVDELSKAPDFEMVRVEEPGFNVSIRKVGQTFDISVLDGDDVVHVQVPMAALEAASRATADGELHLGELAGALHGISRTKIVDVRQPDQDVRVWIW